MPSRNIIRHDQPGVYYHVYARGASKQEIFVDTDDYQFFTSLFARHLSLEPVRSKNGGYPHLRNTVQLLAYCLMPNHFHLMVYQVEAEALAKLMRSVMTSYSGYFNRKCGRSGSLFESRYKSSMIVSDSYLLHISRDIHLNPRYYKRYPYSSYRFYATGNEPEWLQTDKVLELHKNRQSYVEFVADYEDMKARLDDIKRQLAQ